MALALNTSDALASSIVALFAVDDNNTIVDLKAARALTVHANVRLPNSGTPSISTPYGRAFATSGTTSAVYGVDFAAISTPTNAAVWVFAVSNGYTDSAPTNTALTACAVGNDNLGSAIGPGFQVDRVSGGFGPHSGNGEIGASTLIKTAGSIINGAHSFGFVRNNTAAPKAYIDGALDANFVSNAANTSGQYGYASGAAEFGYLGGVQPTSGTHIGFHYVYFVVGVGVEPTASDFARLHASLTGGNAFALVTGAGGGGGSNVAPSVTTQPSAASVTAGAAAVFNYVFAGTPTPTVQAERSTDGGTTWANVSGATATSYTTLATTVTGGTANNGDRYRFTATNSEGPITTNAVVLTVTASSGGGTVPSAAPAGARPILHSVAADGKPIVFVS